MVQRESTLGGMGAIPKTAQSIVGSAKPEELQGLSACQLRSLVDECRGLDSSIHFYFRFFFSTFSLCSFV